MITRSFVAPAGTEDPGRIARPSRSSDAALESFVRDLGYPPRRVSEVVDRLCREWGATTVTEARRCLAEWIGHLRASAVDSARPARYPSADDAVASFVVSGAALWDIDVLFADPATLPSSHRSVLVDPVAAIVPRERPLDMPTATLAARRRRTAEHPARRSNWVPAR
jgi:hypothetical protein